MNLLNKFCYGKINFQLLSSCTFLGVLILFFNSCKPQPEPYSILDFIGDEFVMNYSKSLYMVSYKSDSVNPTALLASEGDLICYGDEFFIYRRSIGNKFQFNTSDEGGYINGKITTLNLRRSNSVIPWFKQMKTADLSALEFIKIDSLVHESYYPYLTDLARIKPGIGLYYDGDLNDISGMIKLFNPRYIVGSIIYGRDFDLLSGLTSLELLVATFDDSVNTGPLPAMPGLKHLFLAKGNDKVILNDKFLSENRSLERITIMESKRIDFSLLIPLSNLKELVLCNFDTIVNFDLIKNHKNLEVLSIIGEKSDYMPERDGLDGIRWITFSPEVTQGVFDSFINGHPDLEVAEILDNDTISSLASLSVLRNLYGLTITDTLTDLASVKSLKNLKYLSLPSSVLEDKVVKDDLHKLMPGSRIVANEGFCLGSGWLLLIVPLILFFSIVAQKKFRTAHNSV
jgi:hypothetical protein